MYWIGVAALAFASWSDLRSREIPNGVPVTVLIVAFAAAAFGIHPLGWGGVGLGFLLGLILGCSLFRTGQLGGGDAKLIIVMGALLGAPMLVLLAAVSCIFGGIVGVLARRRGVREIAFAPVMLIASLSLLPLSLVL